jgi:hypothetical protein
MPDDTADTEGLPQPEGNYIDALNLNDLVGNSDMLFYSGIPVPTDADALKIKEGLSSGLSTFGMAKIRTLLYDAISYFDLIIAEYSAVGSTRFRENLEAAATVYMSYGGKPLSIRDTISELQDIKACVDSPEAIRDIETAQMLLYDTVTNNRIDGLFFAHHILSDLTYWGYMYGLDTHEFLTWELSPDIRERGIFYGLTNTWGYAYPSCVTERIQQVSFDDIEPEVSMDLKTLIDAKDAEIAQLASSMNMDDFTLLAETLDGMNEVLASIAYEGADMQTYNEQLLNDIDICLSISSDSVLLVDLSVVQGNLAEYNEIPKTNTFFPEAEQKYCVYRCKRIVNELSEIVFANDRPTEFDAPYYGMTKVLEGNNAITIGGG